MFGSATCLVKPLAEDEDRSVAIGKRLPYRSGLSLQASVAAEALVLLGEVGEADEFRYKSRALIYEQLAELVDTELVRERVCRHLRSRRQRSPG